MKPGKGVPGVSRNCTRSPNPAGRHGFRSEGAEKFRGDVPRGTGVLWVRGAVQNFRRSKSALVPLSFRSTWNVPPVVATVQDFGERSRAKRFLCRDVPRGTLRGSRTNGFPGQVERRPWTFHVEHEVESGADPLLVSRGTPAKHSNGLDFVPRGTCEGKIPQDSGRST